MNISLVVGLAILICGICFFIYFAHDWEHVKHSTDYIYYKCSKCGEKKTYPLNHFAGEPQDHWPEPGEESLLCYIGGRNNE